MNEYPINLHGKNIETATEILGRKLSPDCICAEWSIEGSSVIVLWEPCKDGRKPSDLLGMQLLAFMRLQTGLIQTAIAETEQELSNA